MANPTRTVRKLVHAFRELAQSDLRKLGDQPDIADFVKLLDQYRPDAQDAFTAAEEAGRTAWQGLGRLEGVDTRISEIEKAQENPAYLGLFNELKDSISGLSYDIAAVQAGLASEKSQENPSYLGLFNELKDSISGLSHDIAAIYENLTGLNASESLVSSSVDGDLLLSGIRPLTDSILLIQAACSGDFELVVMNGAVDVDATATTAAAAGDVKQEITLSACTKDGVLHEWFTGFQPAIVPTDTVADAGPPVVTCRSDPSAPPKFNKGRLALLATLDTGGKTYLAAEDMTIPIDMTALGIASSLAIHNEVITVI